jgi:hypothetical protein
MSLSFILSYENYFNSNYGNHVTAGLIVEQTRRDYPAFPIDKGKITYDHVTGEWTFHKFNKDEILFLLKIIKNQD